MSVSESHISQLSLFGRLADDLTRQVILPPDLNASLEADGRPSLKKSDGYFVFVGLPPSASEYRIQIGAPAFQLRTVAKTRPSATAVEVSFPGEDEAYLIVGDVSVAQSRVTFDPIAFVPPIRAGAAVIGQSGFTATLSESIEGSKISFATLSSVAGLAPNQVLRIVRSPSLLVRPGPYYAFPADMTVVVLKLVDGDPDGPAIVAARIFISKINGAAPNAVDVGGLKLNTFDLGGGARSALVLDDDDMATTTNERGDAVFYFPGRRPLTGIEVGIAVPRFQPVTQTLGLVAKTRNTTKIILSRL